VDTFPIEENLVFYVTTNFHPFGCVSVCNFVVHDRCLKTVVSACSSIAANLIKVSTVFSASDRLICQAVEKERKKP
jgi:hypothetical protein